TALLTARINSYATIVNVDSPAPVPALAGKKGSRGVTKETQFAFIALEEIQVSRPNQHIGVGLRRMDFRNQPRVHINRLFVLVKERQAPHELDVLLRNTDIGYIFQLLKLNTVRGERRQSTVLWNKPLQVAVVQTIKQHLLVIPP